MSLFAQNEVDVLRYSLLNPTGTARYSALGGAFTSLGADISGVINNPAGVAVFRQSEVSLSPGVRSLSFPNVGDGLNSNDVRTEPVVGSAGAVFVSPTNKGRIKFFNFGVAYNRMVTFNQDLSVEGEIDAANSLATSFALDAAGIPNAEIADALPYGSSLAWNAYMIDPDPNFDGVYQPYPSDGEIRQAIVQNEIGRVNEVQLSLGANVEDRLYVGLSVGFVNSEYQNSFTVIEEPINPESSDLTFAGYESALNVTGSGINAKLGVIYRPVERLRLGAAYHSPTSYALTDQFSARAETTREVEGESNNQFFSQSPDGFFEYRLRTPHRWLLGASYLFGNKGLFTVDYEYSDFGRGRLIDSGGGYDYAFENNAVSNNLTTVHNIRAGGEVKFDQLAIRLGGGYRTSPLDETTTGSSDFETITLSGGIGYRWSAIAVDLSYLNRRYEWTNIVFTDAVPLRSDTRETYVQLTVSYRY